MFCWVFSRNTTLDSSFLGFGFEVQCNNTCNSKPELDYAYVLCCLIDLRKKIVYVGAHKNYLMYTIKIKQKIQE